MRRMAILFVLCALTVLVESIAPGADDFEISSTVADENGACESTRGRSNQADGFPSRCRPCFRRWCVAWRDRDDVDRSRRRSVSSSRGGHR